MTTQFSSVQSLGPRHSKTLGDTIKYKLALVQVADNGFGEINAFALAWWIWVCTSVVDPEWFILDLDPDPDPALNFPSSGSMRFWIHADPDSTYIN